MVPFFVVVSYLAVLFPVSGYCLRCTSFGLVRDFLWKKLTLVIFVQGAQSQCRLFHLVQALIFGVLVGFLVP